MSKHKYFIDFQDIVSSNFSTFEKKEKTFSHFFKERPLEVFPTKNLPLESFSILLFNNGNLYKRNNENLPLKSRFFTIGKIKSEFQKFLNIDDPELLHIEINKVSEQIFNEYLLLETKSYNSLELLEIEDRHLKIIKETFNLYKNFKGSSINSFTSSNLLSTKNLTEIYKNTLYLSNLHNENSTIALKLYHLIFCQDTPIFSFSQEYIYPIGIDDKLHNEFIKSNHKELKEIYFKNQELLKFLDDPNILWFNRALLYSFSYNNQKDSELYFLNIWHQFLNNFKKIPSQEKVASKEYQQLFFSLRNSIHQIEKKYPNINFYHIKTDMHDVYSCDLTVDIKNKDIFQYNFKAIETIENIKNYLVDYPSWLAFHFSYYEENRKSGFAQKSTIPMQEGTLDVLFNNKYKQNYFYFIIIKLLTGSQIENIEVSEHFLNILTKNPEQTSFIIDKFEYFLKKLTSFEPSLTETFYFNLVKYKFSKINDNQNYYELDNLFNHLIDKKQFSMFLNIIFNFSHDNNSIIQCLLKNSISLQWIQSNFFQMVKIISNEKFKISFEEKSSFIIKSYKNEKFEKLLSFYQDDKNIKNKDSNSIDSALLEIIIKNYENKFIQEIENDYKILNNSLIPLFKANVSSDLVYKIFKIFKKNINFVANINSQKSLHLKCLSFSKCLSHFNKNDFLFFQKLLDKDDCIISVKNFYFAGLQKNVWNDNEIIKILSKNNAYLLRNNSSFLVNLSKQSNNEKILEQLIYLIIPTSNKVLEQKIFNSPEIYIYFLELTKRFELNNENTPILHDYINSFLTSNYFNSDLKKYLDNQLTIDKYKQLEIPIIEAIIEKYIMKKEKEDPSHILNKKQTVRKF